MQQSKKANLFHTNPVLAGKIANYTIIAVIKEYTMWPVKPYWRNGGAYGRGNTRI